MKGSGMAVSHGCGSDGLVLKSSNHIPDIQGTRHLGFTTMSVVHRIGTGLLYVIKAQTRKYHQYTSNTFQGFGSTPFWSKISQLHPVYRE